MAGPLDFLAPVSDLAKSIIDKIWPPQADPNQKLAAQHDLEMAIQARDNAVIDAQKSITVAEMQQGDAYTKRARPTLVYAGLAFIFLIHVLLPMVAWIVLEIKGVDIKANMPTLSLPDQFWWAWSGVCGIWVIGRSAEKRGVSNAVTGLITGNKK